MNPSASSTNRVPSASARQGRIALAAAPSEISQPRPVPGLHPLRLRPERDAYVYVPKAFHSDGPTPVVVVLHGAGGDAGQGLGLFQKQAEATGALLVIPESLEPTWDVIASDFGPDVMLIEDALRWVRERFDVDTGRLAISGFSDGASYALSLGLTNGDVFTHVLAFSPGFMVVPQTRGRPRIYVSHGTHDSVLPIERCSRQLVPRLKAAGFDPIYWEFEGPHTVPAEAVQSAMTLVQGETAKQ